MKKFEESDCANDCMEIQKLKGRVNLAGTVITLLLGSLLAANAFIYLTLSQVTVQIAQIAAYQTSQKERDVDQQASIEWLMRREMDKAPSVEIWDGKTKRQVK